MLQHDLNRVGGITAARRVPVSPYADQMQNRHLTMANMNFRIVEHFPGFDVEEQPHGRRRFRTSG